MMGEYKGMEKVPEGWKVVILREIAENKKFAIVDGPFGTQLHSEEYVKEGVPLVRIINLSFEGKFIEDELIYITEKKAKFLKRSKVIPGDIIIAKTGATIGKSGIFPAKFLDGIIASSCLKISIDKSKANEKFILYFIASYKGQNAILNSALGTTRTTININPFSNITFLLPPLPEQIKISEILETVDNAIEKTERIIEKYRRIKQGLMHDLLTRGIDENSNIRNEKTHKFKDSPIGRIPEEWEVVSLEEVCYVILSNVDKKIFFNEISVRLCNYLEVYQNDYITSKLGFSKGSVNKREFYNFKVNKGDVIITKDSETFDDIAKAAFVKDEISNLICGYHLCLLKPRNVHGLYLAKVLIQDKINKHFQRLANGITRFGITKETILKANIPLPPLSEQQRIASILSQIDETIEKETAYKEKLQRLKSGLMEDLLTGRVRVNNLVKEAYDEKD